MKALTGSNRLWGEEHGQEYLPMPPMRAGDGEAAGKLESSLGAEARARELAHGNQGHGVTPGGGARARVIAHGSRRRGFTLVEVLATLVLIGIVLPVAMQAISLALRAGGTAKRSVEAVSLAEAKLSELVATGEWQLNLLTGDFGQEWPEYRWQADVYTRSDVEVSELMVKVFYQVRGQEMEVAVATVVYVPAETTEGAGTGATGTGTGTGARP